jgi:DHA3 family macrolide efflux protein-like MFS transporter
LSAATSTTKPRLTPIVITLLSSMLSVVSGSMVFMAFPWLAIKLTGSATSAGAMIAITSIPGLLLAPVVGSIIDKFGRRRVGIIIEFLTGGVTLLIPIAAGMWEMTLPLLIAIGLIRSTVGSGAGSARKSFMPDVARVAGLSLERVNSIQEAIFATGFAIGPALASICIGLFGVYNTFYVVCGFGIISGVLMFFVRIKEVIEPHEEEKNLFKFAMEGFKVLGSTPSVAIMLAGVMTLAMIYLPTEMIVLPKYFTGKGDAQGLGFLLSAMAAATIFGALAFEKLSKRFKYSTIFRIAILGVAFSMIPMSFLPPYAVMIFFGLILGVTWGPITPLLNTVIQRKIAPSKRGRVFSLEMVIWSGGPMLSMVLAGIAVDAFGVMPVYIVLAFSTTTAGLFITFNKRMKEINTADFAD